MQIQIKKRRILKTPTGFTKLHDEENHEDLLSATRVRVHSIRDYTSIPRMTIQEEAANAGPEELESADFRLTKQLITIENIYEQQ